MDLARGRSYLYGRPVTEWSTPPLVSAKAPSSGDAGVHSSGSLDASWQPLTTIATPSHAPTTPLATLASHSHTHRHSIPTTGTTELPSSHLYRRSSDLPPSLSSPSHLLRRSSDLPQSRGRTRSTQAALASLKTPEFSSISSKAPSSVTSKTPEFFSAISETPSATSETPAFSVLPVTSRTTVPTAISVPLSSRSAVTSRTPEISLPHEAVVPPAISTLQEASLATQTRAVYTIQELPVSTALNQHKTQLPIAQSHLSQHSPDPTLHQFPIRRAISDRHLYHPPTYTSTPIPFTSHLKTSGSNSKPPTAKVAPLVGSPPKHTPKHTPKLEEKITVKVSPDLLSHDSRVTSGDLLLGSSEKWKALLETKDRILIQKNQLIERQKQTIAKLHQELRERESQLVRGHDEVDGFVRTRIQELEARCSSLEADLVRSSRSKNTEIERLSKKLDAAEYELQKMTEALSESREQSARETSALREELKRSDEQRQGLEVKLTEAGKVNTQLKEHVAKLSGYLGNMPTMEEHHALQQQAQSLQEQCETLSSNLAAREQCLKETRSTLQNKEQLSERLESELRTTRQELEETRSALEPLAGIQPEYTRLKSECQRLQRLVFESEGRCRQELQLMRERHKEKFTEATAKLRSQHKAMAKRVKMLETQLLKNSDAMSALNSELQMSHGAIGNLKSSIRELVTQNQGLVERNISLQEATAEAVRTASSLSEVQSSTAQQLAIELSRCVEDFESLVHLSSSIMEGKDPSTSLLLGVKGNPSASDVGMMWEGEGYEVRLEQVRRLQEEVERLRVLISDQFAAQVSSNCNVQ